MNAEPLLIETAHGVIGSVVVTPVSPVQGGAVILPGVGSTRAGSNQMFVRMAEALATAGVASLRFDYPGTGESHLGLTTRWRETTAEVTEWFRTRCGTPRLLLIADCSGVVGAHREVMSGRGVAGVAMVRPAFPEPWPRPSSRRRLRTAAGRVKRLPGTALLRLRHGRADPKIQGLWSKDDAPLMARTGELLVEISRRVPLWILTAVTDPATPVLRGLQERLDAGVAYELEILDGALSGGGSRPGVTEMARSTATWATRRLRERPLSEGPPAAGAGSMVAPGACSSPAQGNEVWAAAAPPPRGEAR